MSVKTSAASAGKGQSMGFGGGGKQGLGMFKDKKDDKSDAASKKQKEGSLSTANMSKKPKGAKNKLLKKYLNKQVNSVEFYEEEEVIDQVAIDK